MKIAVIGDIHGTTKFLECYKNIQKNDSISEINMNLSNDATNVSNSVGVPEVNIPNSGTSSEPVSEPAQGTNFDLLKDNEDVWKF